MSQNCPRLSQKINSLYYTLLYNKKPSWRCLFWRRACYKRVPWFSMLMNLALKVF